MVLLCLGILADCVVIYWIDYPYHCDTTGLGGSLDCSKEPDGTVGVALMARQLISASFFLGGLPMHLRSTAPYHATTPCDVPDLAPVLIGC